tara:strand:- start:851 stop:1723 length:873 start_codon:yes stop_codon:yes gene_type:complete
MLGTVASSTTPYGYEFYGNQPLAWWDFTLSDSTDVDGSDKVSAWRSRWTGKVPSEDWTLSQSEASKQPKTRSAVLTNRGGGDCFTGGSIEFKAGGTSTGLLCGSDTNRHIDSPLWLIAMYQSTYSSTQGICGQFGTSDDWDDDRGWQFYNMQTSKPKENRLIWAYASSTSYKYMTNWSPGSYDSDDNPGVYFDHVGGGRIPSDTNKPSLFMKDLTKKNSSAYQKDSDVFYNFHLGYSSDETYPFDGYIAEVILFDATESEFSNAQVEALSLQIAKRHNLDSTNNASGIGY